MNDRVLKITTPYMRFYELAALFEIGQHNNETNEMLNYLGATTIDKINKKYEIRYNSME